MLSKCVISDLKICTLNETVKRLADELSCPELAAGVLDMLRGSDDVNALREWLRPDFEALINNLELGEGAIAAKELWEKHSSFGNVLVYGDYDTDGVCSTVLAMELFSKKASQVRFFIPRRDVHGYGLNADVLDKVASWNTDTLVVTDCGTNDSEMLEKLRRSGVEVFVFDHHAVSAPVTVPTIVNPVNPANPVLFNADNQDITQKICATAVLWCWAWKENIVPKEWLKYELDLVALATIADCMPLHNLNRLVVRYGLSLMKTHPRRGLAVLFDGLGINKSQLSEEQLSMRVIPCLNAPGRITNADVSVSVLLGTGSGEALYSCVNELMRINRKRQSLAENIAHSIEDGILTGNVTHKVLYHESWPIGVLSGVASRICAQHNMPIVLAAPVGSTVIRGTLRVPEGGDAVGILRKIADKLDAWGGHKYAAGFSVLTSKWPEVRKDLEQMLTDIEIVPESQTSVIDIEPSDITIQDWRAVSAIGPFGNNNPSPKFFVSTSKINSEINPMGKDGKHSFVRVNNNARLLAFNTPARDVLDIIGSGNIKGWIYHPRLEYWKNEEQLQFILDCAVFEGGES